MTSSSLATPRTPFHLAMRLFLLAVLIVGSLAAVASPSFAKGKDGAKDDKADKTEQEAPAEEAPAATSADAEPTPDKGCVNYHFTYTDGHVDSGEWCGKGMNVTSTNTPGLHVTQLHVSCSDTFTNGETDGQSKLDGHLVSRYRLVKGNGAPCGGDPIPSGGTTGGGSTDGGSDGTTDGATTGGGTDGSTDGGTTGGSDGSADGGSATDGGNTDGGTAGGSDGSADGGSATDGTSGTTGGATTGGTDGASATGGDTGASTGATDGGTDAGTGGTPPGPAPRDLICSGGIVVRVLDDATAEVVAGATVLLDEALFTVGENMVDEQTCTVHTAELIAWPAGTSPVGATTLERTITEDGMIVVFEFRLAGTEVLGIVIDNPTGDGGTPLPAPAPVPSQPEAAPLTLPRTGSETTYLVLAALFALALGGAALDATRGGAAPAQEGTS